ncbi:MAG TPA: serine/threonine-protein kinase, partial [Bryobacteraceae bacterium]
MDPQDWEKVCRYFDRCAELSEEECELLLDSEPSQEIRDAVWRLRSLHKNNLSDGLLDRSLELPSDFPSIRERINRFSSGDKVGNRFEIVRLIGSGGMGEVYEATDLELGETVAIKVLTESASMHGSAVPRFRREVQLARRITHPNVCRLFDLGRHTSPDGDAVFLTMEFLDGETLSQRIKTQKVLTMAEARPIVEQVVAGLAAAHRSGIVHRDLKPSNIMLCADRAVIMDFGLARHGQSTGDPSLTSTGKVIGTLTYIAPEQLTGDAITAKTDIYALGLVMYEMVTGKRPFASENSLAGANRRLTESALPPRNIVPELNARWQNSILSCLERDPALRPESAEAVVELLDSAPKFRLRPVTRRRILQSGAGLAGVATLVALREPVSRYLNRRLESAPGAKILV